MSRYRLIGLFLLVIVAGCDSYETPKNVINDGDGLLIGLTWSTGGTEEQAIEKADLDLYLYDPNMIELVHSGTVDQFENIFFDAFHDSGDYTLKVKVNSVAEAAEFNVTVKGFNSENSIQKKNTVSSNVPAGTEINVYTITKRATKFTLKKAN